MFGAEDGTGGVGTGFDAGIYGTTNSFYAIPDDRTVARSSRGRAAGRIVKPYSGAGGFAHGPSADAQSGRSLFKGTAYSGEPDDKMFSISCFGFAVVGQCAGHGRRSAIGRSGLPDDGIKNV